MIGVHFGNRIDLTLLAPTERVFDWLACITARPKTERAHTQQQPIDESEIQTMLEQMLAKRGIEKIQCNIKNAKTELKYAIRINSGIKIWDWNQMLRSHNNLHPKWHTRSNMSVPRRNGQQTWILHMAMPQVLQRCNTGHGVVGALGSQAQHMRGVCWELLGTVGRSWVVMWCFGMRHFAPWRMTVVCVGLALHGASSRVSAGPGPSPGGRVCALRRWLCRALSPGQDMGAAL